MRLKDIVRSAAPHGLVVFYRRRRDQQAQARALIHAQRYERIRLVGEYTRARAPTFDYQRALEFLLKRGVPVSHLLEGTIPFESIRFIGEHIDHQCWESRRLVALHIGSFVGMSLCALASILKDHHNESVIVSIDPNIPHRGIDNPHDHMLALANHFGLSKNILPVVAYSGAKSISNDGVVFEGYDPVEHFCEEHACEGALENVVKLGSRCFDIALLDGNHEAAYLRTEIETLVPLMRSGGLLILDDVDDAWEELKAVYRGLPGAIWEDRGTNGRVGILCRI